MAYLICVLNETARPYPQLPANIPFATETMLLPRGGGPSGAAPVLIQDGTGVGYSVCNLHRRKDLEGANADNFRPERWDIGERGNI